MFIQLKEYYYSNGGYSTKPICCNVNEIGNVQECYGGYSPDYCLVTMKNGKSYKVADNYDDIISRLVGAHIEGEN